MALAAVALAMLAEWHDEPWQVVAAMLVFGLGIPMTFAAMANVIVTSVRTAKTIEGGGIPQESAFATAFWISAAGAVVGAGVALLITRRPGRAEAREAVRVSP